MDVVVNGEQRSLQLGTTVAELVALLGGPADGRGVAVAIDTEVVPRSAWWVTELPPGARVEVLIAVQGG
jgi:sulfur carrier protein